MTEFRYPTDKEGKPIRLTYRQVQAKKAVSRYTKEMLSLVKASGKEPFIKRNGEVVVDRKWGGGSFPTIEEAYESICLFLFYPDTYKSLKTIGA